VVLSCVGLPAQAADIVYKCMHGHQPVYSTKQGCPDAILPRPDPKLPSTREPSPADLAAQIQAEYEKEKADRAAALAAEQARQKAVRDRTDRARSECQAEMQRRSVVINSGWDGSVYQVVQYLKHHLKDPDSFDAIDWGRVDRSCAGYTVQVRYRARNSFGGMVIETREFQLDTAGNVISMN